jgi:cobalt transport protein
MRWPVIIAAGAIAFLAAFYAAGAGMVGSDDRAADVVGDITENSYTRWISPIYEPGDDMEPILFGLQAGAGAVVLSYFILRIGSMTKG